MICNEFLFWSFLAVGQNKFWESDLQSWTAWKTNGKADSLVSSFCYFTWKQIIIIGTNFQLKHGINSMTFYECIHVSVFSNLGYWLLTKQGWLTIPGEWGWLSGRAADLWLKGLRFKSQPDNFLLQGQHIVLNLISVSVPPPPCYCNST